MADAKTSSISIGRAVLLFFAIVGGLGTLVAGAIFLRGPAPSPIEPMQSPATPAPAAPAAQAAPPLPTHNYDVREGFDYGYTRAISQAEQSQGQVGAMITMMSYAGQHEGRHQVHTRMNNVLVAFECSAPCDVVKALTVIDADGMRQDVNVERLRSAPNMIAFLALQDAMRGELQEYAEIQGQRRFLLWVDERKGLVRTRISDRPASAPAS